MSDMEKLLDKKTVLERYHLTKWSLEWLIRTRQIPGMVRIGKRKIFFDPRHLESWIEKNWIAMANGKAGEE
jgi:hypothetical protein